MKLFLFLNRFISYFFVLLLMCCTPNYGKNLDGRDSDLYGRVGYKPGSRPAEIQQNNDIAKMANKGQVMVVPDYYYRTPDQKSIRARPVRRAASVASVPYQPSSRYYNNPYSFKPPLNFPYFDSDQYYVPPTGYSARGHDSHSRSDGGSGENSNQDRQNRERLY